MTEKDYNPEQRNQKAMKKQEKVKQVVSAPEKKEEKIEEKDNQKASEPKGEVKKSEPKASDKKKPEVKKIKKTEAVVNGKSLPISTLYSVAVCKFIKKKTIENAIKDLEDVLRKVKAVPMTGEIPHRKGKIMSGRYPKNAAEAFIRLLKNLRANAIANELDNPIIVEAIANMASRPYGRFGSVRRKRTHVLIKVKERTKKRGKKKK